MRRIARATPFVPLRLQRLEHLRPGPVVCLETRRPKTASGSGR